LKDTHGTRDNITNAAKINVRFFLNDHSDCALYDIHLAFSKGRRFEVTMSRDIIIPTSPPSANCMLVNF
jgi:hypothetical protein